MRPPLQAIHSLFRDDGNHDEARVRADAEHRRLLFETPAIAALPSECFRRVLAAWPIVLLKIKMVALH
jgi:hypothetical protein